MGSSAVSPVSGGGGDPLQRLHCLRFCTGDVPLQILGVGLWVKILLWVVADIDQHLQNESRGRSNQIK